MKAGTVRMRRISVVTTKAKLVRVDEGRLEDSEAEEKGPMSMPRMSAQTSSEWGNRQMGFESGTNTECDTFGVETQALRLSWFPVLLRYVYGIGWWV